MIGGIILVFRVNQNNSMKRNAIIFFFSLIPIIGSAQSFDLGIKGGVNYSQATILNVIGMDGVDMNDVESQSGVGLVFGGFMRITTGKLILEPELLFSENESLVTLADANIQNADIGDLLSMKVDKVDMPLLVGYNFLNKIRLMAGPVLSNIKATDSDPLFDLGNITIGYQLGFGFDADKLAFDARYEGNLSKFKDYIETDNGTVQVDTRRNLFQFTIGYKLF